MWLMLIAVPLYTSSLLRQLHGAVRREKVANQAKSSFLANMSHEIRTPLNGVIGVADLLAETKLDKEQKEFAQIIRASANTLLELIDNVLDISRIETGRLATTGEDFDLHRLVNGTIAMMETLAQRKGLVLGAHIAPQTPFQLHGDARHLRQILINLIGNAIKFTEHGRVDVYVRPAGQGHPQRLRFEIVDTESHSESRAGTIFDSFTRPIHPLPAVSAAAAWVPPLPNSWWKRSTVTSACTAAKGKARHSGSSCRSHCKPPSPPHPRNNSTRRCGWRFWQAAN